MRIGIELGQIVPGACGGIVPLLEGVFRALFAPETEHKFVVYCTPANRQLFDPAPGVEVLTLPGKQYFALLDRHACERRLDVLFRSFPLHVLLAYPLARQIFLIPDLQHEFFPEFFDPAVLARRRAAFGQALASAAAIGTISEHARQTVCAHPATRCNDVFLMGPALTVPPDEELTGDEHAVVPAGDFFLYPANLWPHKNHRRLLQAFRLFTQHSDRRVELVLTGHPAGLDGLEGEFAGLPVHHLGFVRRTLLEQLLRRAKALVFFSLFEGFGMPLVEAFHAGTPVLCSNTSSLPEVGGDAVLSCDPTDPEAMGRLMLELTRDRGLHDGLVARGRERLRLFRWEDSARSLLAACARVAGRAAPCWGPRAVRPAVDSCRRSVARS
jgi:glycosyltransferase involved in cell wall biosynthesis